MSGPETTRARLQLAKRTSVRWAATNLLLLHGLLAAGVGSAQTRDLVFGSGGIALPDVRVPSRDVRINGLITDVQGRSTLGGSSLARLLPDGSLDVRFGSSSLGSIPKDSSVSRVLLDPSGRLLVLVTGSQEYSIQRLLPTGALDTSFAAGGRLSLSGIGFFLDFHVDAQGRPVLLATTGLHRFSADGRPDASFGVKGRVLTYGQRVAAGAGGRLLVLNRQTLEARSSDGGLDTSYGSAGSIELPMPDTTQPDLASSPDGSSFASCAIQVPGDPDAVSWLVVKVTPDGRLDPAFGVGGLATLSWFRGTPSPRLTLDPRGRPLLLAGPSQSRPGSLGRLARISEGGQLDPTFGSGGFVWLPEAETTGFASQLTAAVDGSILIGGEIDLCERHLVFLARLSESGALDASFGTDGIVTTDLGGTDRIGELAGALAPAGGGRLLMASYDSGLRDPITILRLRRDGLVDPTFGRDGSAQTPFEGCASSWAPVAPIPGNAVSLAVYADGRFLASGWHRTAGEIVMRFLPSGFPDPSFGRGGFAPAPGIFRLRGLVTRRDGGVSYLFCSGESSPCSNARVAALRPDGSPDVDFGSLGSTALPFVPVALDEDAGRGHLIAGFQIPPGATSYAFAVLRLRPDGRIDDAFGSGGIAYAPFPSSPAGAFAVGMATTTERIVVAGISGRYPAYKVAVAAFLPDGRPDPSFGAAGAGRVEVTGPSTPTGVLVQPDRRIVVFGTESFGRTSAIRLLPGGEPDATFGAGGRLAITEPIVGFYLRCAVLPEPGRLVFGGRVNLSGPDPGYGQPGLVGYAVTTPVSLMSFTAE